MRYTSLANAGREVVRLDSPGSRNSEQHATSGLVFASSGTGDDFPCLHRGLHRPRTVSPGNYWKTDCNMALWFSCQSSVDDSYCFPVVGLDDLSRSLVGTLWQFDVSVRILLQYSACRAHTFEYTRQRPSAVAVPNVCDRPVLCGRCVQRRCPGVEPSAVTQGLQAPFFGCPSAAMIPLVARR